MPIRNVVTMGFGNGVFSPGASFIPTLGYSIQRVDFIQSEARPTVRVGGTLRVRVDLRKDLDEGDTVASVSVADITTTDLTFTGVGATTAVRVMAGRFVPAGRGVEFFVSGHAVGTYRLKITFNTSAGILNKSPKEDFVFDVIA